MRDIYFLADSSLLVDFCNALFENAYATFTADSAHASGVGTGTQRKVRGVRLGRRGYVPGSLLRDEHRLNRVLASSTTAARTNADLAQRFGVSVLPRQRSQTRTSPSAAEKPFDRLRIEYRVPWPLDQIVRPEHLSAYNTVQRMLLTIKSVVFGLQRCRFHLAALGGHRCITVATKRPLPHLPRLQIYVAEYAHVVRSLEDFMLNQAVFGSWEAFQRKVAAASSIFEVRDAHGEYLNQVLQQTLLNPSRKAVQKTIGTVLSNAITFIRSVHRVVDVNADTNSDGSESFQAFAQVEHSVVEFRRTISFMLRLLDKHSFGGSAPALRAVFVRLSFNNFYTAAKSKPPSHGHNQAGARATGTPQVVETLRT